MTEKIDIQKFLIENNMTKSHNQEQKERYVRTIKLIAELEEVSFEEAKAIYKSRKNPSKEEKHEQMWNNFKELAKIHLPNE